MSTTASDRRRAAAFVLSSALLLGLLLALLGGQKLAVRYRPYVAVFRESVSGLEPSSVIVYKGVPIGVVRAIRMSPGSLDQIEVELAVRTDVTIKADMRAQLRPQGITGLYQLELSGGTTAAADLEEGGVIAADDSVMSTLESTLHDVADVARDLEGSGGDVKAAIADLREALVAGRDAARALGASAAAIGTDVGAGIATLTSDVGAGIASLTSTSDEVRALAADPAWRTLSGELVQAVADLRRAAAALDRAASGVARVADENRDDVRALVEDLRRASGDVRAVTRRLRDSPTSLVIEHPTVEKPIPDPPPETRR